ncbi:sigma-54-dependent Fis family transcriptional regulator [Amaricoccus tamworthensis]|uniref:sigma-54-dependent Fis family transcriptional regulator n=1 Tax=Amaricoccus tamworthensis TaxID=57002 RepID=UPI003C7C0B0C
MKDHSHIEEIGQVLDGTQTGRDDFVSDSWRRCVEVYGMDPTRREPAHVVTEAELRDHRKQAEWMIAAARSGLQSLFRQVSGQDYVLLLADAKGVCVDFFGDDNFLDDLRSAGLYLGYNWSEDLAGTCGVGACIVTQQPVTIHQDDHFGNAHTALSCTAAPIFDSLGQMAAVLDISLLRSPTPKTSQKLAMSLVTNSARRVEMANLMAESRQDWVLRLSASPEFLDVDPEAAVRLDGSGRVIGHTNAARQLFPDGDPIIGRGIDEVLGITVDDLPDLMRNRPTEDRVVEMLDGGALFGHAIAPRNPRRTYGGVRRGGVLAGLSDGDPVMTRMLSQAEKLAKTSIPLLIHGETGTGKTKLARTIHMTGRAGGFVSIDCAGATATALEEAFSHVFGPTTLLLRHIEYLEEATSALLSGFLDQRPDVRTLSTSTVSPKDLALPQSLFHRLHGYTLSLPPLRQRQDLGWLIDRLLRRRAPDDFRLSPSARADLMGRTWAGNLRELEHALDVAVALCEGQVIDLPDLPRAADAPGETGESLEQILDACGWNMARAARRLGVNRSTVLRRMRREGLQAPN